MDTVWVSFPGQSIPRLDASPLVPLAADTMRTTRVIDLLTAAILHKTA